MSHVREVRVRTIQPLPAWLAPRVQCCLLQQPPVAMCITRGYVKGLLAQLSSSKLSYTGWTYPRPISLDRPSQTAHDSPAASMQQGQLQLQAWHTPRPVASVDFCIAYLLLYKACNSC